MNYHYTKKNAEYDRKKTCDDCNRCTDTKFFRALEKKYLLHLKKNAKKKKVDYIFFDSVFAYPAWSVGELLLYLLIVESVF